MSSDPRAGHRFVPNRAVELMEASVGRAAGALCAMLNVDVEPSAVAGDAVPVPLAPRAVNIGVLGDLTGSIVLVVLSPATLAELLRVPDELVESAIAEVGNIVASHLVLGLEEAADASLSITPPAQSNDELEVADWVEAGTQRAWVTLGGLSPVVVVLTLRASAPIA
jgi:CheY-specific phosphatase CheX